MQVGDTKHSIVSTQIDDFFRAMYINGRYVIAITKTDIKSGTLPWSAAHKIKEGERKISNQASKHFKTGWSRKRSLAFEILNVPPLKRGAIRFLMILTESIPK
jgi:hypothetical protein